MNIWCVKAKKTSCLVILNNIHSLISIPPRIAKRHGIINRSAAEQPLDSFPSTLECVISPLPTVGCTIRLSLCSFPTCLQGPSWKHFNSGVCFFDLTSPCRSAHCNPGNSLCSFLQPTVSLHITFSHLFWLTKWKKKQNKKKPCQASRLSQLKQVKGFNSPVMINDNCKGAAILK